MTIRKHIKTIATLGCASAVFLGGVTAVFAQDATPDAGSAQPTAAELCGQASVATPTTGPVDQSMPSMVEFDLLFIDLMVSHHQGAVAMAVIAQERGEHPEIRQLAGEIIAAQQPEIEQMNGWRVAWYPGAPVLPEAQAMNAFDRMTSSMPGMGGMPGASEMMMGNMHDLEALCAASPDAFDLIFLDGMIAHHQSAIMMAQSALNHATHDEIKTLATAIIAAQQKEIDAMLAWRAAWYPDATPENTQG